MSNIDGADDTRERDDAQMTDTEIAQDQTERRARAMGWVPQDEWRGPPNKWVDADGFMDTALANRRGFETRLERMEQSHTRDMAEIRRANEETAGRLKDATSVIQSLNQTNKRIAEQSYRRAKEELEAKMEEAVGSSDTATYRTLRQQRDDLETDQREQRRPERRREDGTLDTRTPGQRFVDDGGDDDDDQNGSPRDNRRRQERRQGRDDDQDDRRQERQRPADPTAAAVQANAWRAANPWYDANPKLGKAVFERVSELDRSHPNLTVTQRLEMAADEVKDKFPEDFGLARRRDQNQAEDEEDDQVDEPPNRRAAAAVGASRLGNKRRDGNARGGGKTVKDLPPDAQRELTKIKSFDKTYKDEDFLREFVWPQDDKWA